MLPVKCGCRYSAEQWGTAYNTIVFVMAAQSAPANQTLPLFFSHDNYDQTINDPIIIFTAVLQD